MAAVLVRVVSGDPTPPVPDDAASGASPSGGRGGSDESQAEADEVRAEADEIAAELGRLASRLPERLDAGPEDVERGLARLVLSLVEFLRQVLEKQAIRRVEAGSLTEDEVERLGLTLLRLRERMDELKAAFDVDDQDLSLSVDARAPARGPTTTPAGAAPGPGRGDGNLGDGGDEDQ